MQECLFVIVVFQVGLSKWELFEKYSVIGESIVIELSAGIFPRPVFSTLHGGFIALRIHGFVTEHEASIFGPVILVSFFEGENDEIDEDNCFGIISARGGRFGVGR